MRPVVAGFPTFNALPDEGHAKGNGTSQSSSMPRNFRRPCRASLVCHIARPTRAPTIPAGRKSILPRRCCAC